jgi:hypothetical protein
MGERAHYFHSLAENAKIAGWVAERGDSNPPRCLLRCPRVAEKARQARIACCLRIVAK